MNHGQRAPPRNTVYTWAKVPVSIADTAPRFRPYSRAVSPMPGILRASTFRQTQGFHRLITPEREKKAEGNPSASFTYLPQHFLYFLPEPHGQGSFLPIFGVSRTIGSGLTNSPSINFHSPSMRWKNERS